MTALQRFDPSRKSRFSTYSTWWVRQAIIRAIEETSEKEPFRLPVNQREKNRAIARAAVLFFEQQRRWPNDRELWQALRRLKTNAAREMSRKEMTRCQSILLYKYHSFDAAVGSKKDNDCAFEEVIADPRADVEREVDIALMRERSMEALGNSQHFTPREAVIVSRRLAIGGGKQATLRELGEQFNISREYVRVLQKKATRRLAARFRARQKEAANSADSSI